MALWVCFSWCIDSANTAPILAISSPEKRCGKTTVLSLLNLVVKRPLSTSNITPAALFRAIEEYKPTLLIDEADTFIKQSDDLRGILNSGHTRSTAFVLRTIGDEHLPKAFNTWGAKAIALIGKLPDTLHDRSIVIPLKRKLTHEKTERLYRTDYNFDLIKSKLARFADDYAEDVKEVIPKSLNHVSDRAADNWEVLLAIASLAGEQWEDRTTKAIMALSDKSGEPKTYGVTLLADIKEIFESKNVDKIFSGDLITELCNDKEKPWSTFRHGNPIDQRVLANLLKEFAIDSKNIRVGSQVHKGYDLEQFSDSFSRYTSISPNLSATALQMTETDDFIHVSLPLQNILENLSATRKPLASKDCSAVADKTPKNTHVDEYLLEERAAIMEYDGGLTREEAELAVWGRVITKNCNREN
jgi:putative DNA primase/helicase